MQFENPVIIENSVNVQQAVIWLHGLGADGYDFEPIVKELPLPNRDQIRFIFPHAKVQPVTINGGMESRAWFDIYTLTEVGNEDIEGMRETNQYIHHLIDQQIAAGIDSKNIVLAGFSQGGAMALFSGLTYAKPLAGIIGLSTFLGGSLNLATERSSANQATPVLMCHGELDSVVPTAYGLQSSQILQDWGYNVTWHSYPMGHEVCAAELVDTAQFMLKSVG